MMQGAGAEKQQQALRSMFYMQRAWNTQNQAVIWDLANTKPSAQHCDSLSQGWKVAEMKNGSWSSCWQAFWTESGKQECQHGHPHPSLTVLVNIPACHISVSHAAAEHVVYT